jgi:hypothetical protein
MLATVHILSIHHGEVFLHHEVWLALILVMLAVIVSPGTRR